MSTAGVRGAVNERRRERHQIGWAAATLVFGGAPHLFSVAPWIVLAVLAITLWRVAAAAYNWKLPPLWLRLPLTLLTFAGVLFTYRAISGIEAGSALLLVMAALKLLETSTDRDRMVVVFIGYFLLFAVLLREQAIWSFAWFAFAVTGITAALTQTIGRGPLRSTPAAGVHAALLLLQALPLAALLFLLFPRLPGPFWALPNTTRTGISGLAEQIHPGDISELSLSDAVAFRVRFDGRVPGAGSLYWRGPVLEQFDGRVWSAVATSRQAQTRTPRTSMEGAAYGYQVVLEPHGARWLLALETPIDWSLPHAALGPALQLLNRDTVYERISYRARSVTGGTGAVEAEAVTLSLNQRLPEGLNPQALALARMLRAGSDSDALFLDRLLHWFAERPFVYTLSPPPLGQHTVDEFLFSTRAGFCEHYASALTVLLRAGGVPARVVVGYQGAERNPFGDYWIVRQANAHAWVEAWLEGAWRRVDPTAVVAPERIEQGYAETLAETPRVTARLWRSNLYVNRLALSWDAMNAAWDRWVLAYGPQMQYELLLALGFKVPRTIQLTGLATGASMICLFIMAMALGHHRRRHRDPVARQYGELCRRLARAVRPRRPAETPEAYARSIAELRPDLAPEVLCITDLYLRVRYGGDDHASRRRQLIRAVRRFRPRATGRRGGSVLRFRKPALSANAEQVAEG